MKKILVINGHPQKESFCGALAKKYEEGASASGADCFLVNLHELHFNLNLEYGYKKQMELEPDLVKAQSLIQDADHVVFVYPIWWAMMPALLKGFIDRVFLSGFAFKYRSNSPLWDKLLTGKTARIIITMDSPRWYYRFVLKSPGINAMKKGVLEFCGFKPVKVTVFTPLRKSADDTRQKWLHSVELLGRQQS